MKKIILFTILILNLSCQGNREVIKSYSVRYYDNSDNSNEIQKDTISR